MLRNLFRQSFWAVFLPLLLAAGLFWMDEMRGYRGEISIAVLPKVNFATNAAANLAALSRETTFALAVYQAEDRLANPFVGKTPAERKALWRENAEIRTVGTSEVIHVSARGSESDDAQTLTRAIVAELVRTASRYYNQKTDIDIRIVSDLVIIPSYTAWPRFLSLAVVTALGFTALFFFIYRLIEWVFPQRRSPTVRDHEYTITPETFTPRIPAYWGREEHTHLASPETSILSDQEPTVESPSPTEAESTQPLSDSVETAEAIATAIAPTEVPSDMAGTPVADTVWETTEPDESPEVPPIEEDIASSAEPSVSYEAERAGLVDEASTGYVYHAAAPDNLPIVDGPITPLQGAQARLMKADIDATARTLAQMPEQSTRLEPAGQDDATLAPQTHEPTPEEYRRRLNELLSGKM
ncbi:MAG: hypothetical protein WAT84_02060 [Candidatus Moraniibacteriota bacterium]